MLTGKFYRPTGLKVARKLAAQGSFTDADGSIKMAQPGDYLVRHEPPVFRKGVLDVWPIPGDVFENTHEELESNAEDPFMFPTLESGMNQTAPERPPVAESGSEPVPERTTVPGVGDVDPPEPGETENPDEPPEPEDGNELPPGMDENPAAG